MVTVPDAMVGDGFAVAVVGEVVWAAVVAGAGAVDDVMGADVHAIATQAQRAMRERMRSLSTMRARCSH